MAQAKTTIALSGGPIDEAPAKGWKGGEIKAFPDPHNPKVELGYRRLHADEFTDVDPYQAVYIGRRRVGTEDWRS